jgi:hypothetical protein
MGSRTERPVSPRPCGANYSAVRIHHHTSRAYSRYRSRRVLAEHLGLIPPQNVTSRREHVTTFMRPAPVANEDETYIEDDARVADPLSDQFLNLLNTTARVNREVFTELFRPIPSNLVHNWNAYDVSARRANLKPCAYWHVQAYKPKVKVGHVVPGVPLHRVKERLALVRGSIVEAPIVRCHRLSSPSGVVLTYRVTGLFDRREGIPGGRGMDQAQPHASNLYLNVKKMTMTEEYRINTRKWREMGEEQGSCVREVNCILSLPGL